MKDSQISKVFRAENEFLTNTQCPKIWTIDFNDWTTWTTSQKLLNHELNRILNRNSFQSRYNGVFFTAIRPRTVRGITNCGSSQFGFSSQSTWKVYQSNLYLYHNLAHHCSGSNQHHAGFVRIYLDFVGQFLGVEAKRELTACMREQKAKTRVVSQETREKQRNAYLIRRDKGPMIASLRATLKMLEES